MSMLPTASASFFPSTDAQQAIASSVDAYDEGSTEVLALSDYLSKYEFLQGIQEIKETATWIEVDAQGFPIREVSAAKCTYIRDYKYEITRSKDVRTVQCPMKVYVTLIWETERTEAMDSIVWFKTYGAHNFIAGSVVHLSKTIPELQGFHVVDNVAREMDGSDGTTLFSVSNVSSKLGSVGRQWNGVLWLLGNGMEAGECVCQFEIDPTRTEACTVTCKRRIVRQMTSVMQPECFPEPNPMISGFTNGSQNLQKSVETTGVVSSSISQSVIEQLRRAKITYTEAERASKGVETSITANSATPSTEDYTFNGFKPVQAENPNVEVISSLMATQTTQTKQQPTFHPLPMQRSQLSGEGDEVGEVEDFAVIREIISDVESEHDGVDEITEEVPLSDEIFALTELQCSPAVKESVVLSYNQYLTEKLLEVGRILRFILLDDHVGAKFARDIGEQLSERIGNALMQNGESIFLVPQKMYGALHRSMQRVDLSYRFYGAVLLHVLDILDRIFREQEFNTVRFRMEDTPRNPYEQMLNSGHPELSYPLSAGANSDIAPTPQMPYLASIIDQPDLTTLTDQQLKSLFKNAPYLMKHEVSTPNFLTKMKNYVGQRASGPLRKYQESCVEKFMTGGNFIFVAPTGAGKTKIFVECSRQLLKKNKAATIVVTCPSVALATQQACVYVVEGFLTEGYWVNTFSSDNQLHPQAWRHLASCTNVMVLTPQLLLNIMDFYKDVDGYSIFNEIDLLILDECHHVRKEHAYNKIMTAHRATPNCKTQVIGFTASPTRSPDVEEGGQNLQLLLDQMQAKCVVLTDANMEVQQHVPAAKEETAYCEEREEDLLFARHIGLFMYYACQRYINPLVGRERGVFRLPDQSMRDMGQGLQSSTFENWARLTTETLDGDREISFATKTDIVSSIELLRACNNSLDLTNDAGFESALKVLAQKIIAISSTLGNVTGLAQRIFPNLLAGFYSSRIIQSITPVLQSYGMSPFTSKCSKFPRFIQLVQFLERYKDQESLHGMVFVKTRDGVYHLAKMLRLAPSLRNTLIFEFTGHGQGSKKKNPLSVTASETLRGMSGSKQQEILEKFCRSGRHILCATSAAEEGINVVTCQFVVRYSVTYTGIQRVQSRGRSRVQGGIFFNIIQKHSKEGRFLEKSQQEEVNMIEVLKNSERVEHL